MVLDGTISVNLQPFQETHARRVRIADGFGRRAAGAGAHSTLPPNFADAVKMPAIYSTI